MYIPVKLMYIHTCTYVPLPHVHVLPVSVSCNKNQEQLQVYTRVNFTQILALVVLSSYSLWSYSVIPHTSKYMHNYEKD